ncbi:MAG: PEGA domain-containing protein [Polyangiaceae bacterium]
MSSRECERWTGLSDQEALGEELSEFDARFLQQHPAQCAYCAAESRAFSALSGSLEDAQLLGSPLELAPERARFGLVRRIPRPAWLAAALAAAALIAAPLLKRTLDTKPAPSATAPSAATLLLRSGNAEVDGAPAVVGVQLSEKSRLDSQQGRFCAGFEPGVWTCMGEHSRAEVGALGAHRSLKLLSGRVLARLDPQPSGRTFAVETAQVSVLAKGTLFAVELDGRGETLVRLYEGSVALRASGGRELTLRAPSEARVGASIEARAMTAAPERRDQELIALTHLGSPQSASRLSVSSLPSGAGVLVDGTPLGPAPVSALVPSGGLRLSLELSGYAPVSERLSLQGGAAVTRDYELAALPPLADNRPAAVAPARAVDVSASDSATRATPAELLTRARAARASGRFAEAAHVYRQLMQAFPHSAEARVSLVSLGEMSLSELNDARSALGSFDAYLKQGGGLTQEARYGRIRALGRLGRKAQERAAIESFLTDYPQSVQAASLRGKLESR